MEEHVIAARVRRAREWRGWSQQELSRRAALHPVVLNRLEKKHKAGVQAETIRRLAVALQVSADYLLGITTDTLPAPAHNADSTENMAKYLAMTQASIDAAMGFSWDGKRQTSHVSASPEQVVEPQREQTPPAAPSTTRPREAAPAAPSPATRQRTPQAIVLDPAEYQDVTKTATTPQPTVKRQRTRKATAGA